MCCTPDPSKTEVSKTLLGKKRKCSDITAYVDLPCKVDHTSEEYAGRTFQELVIDTGGDVAKVTRDLSDLDNNIHPIFQHNNVTVKKTSTTPDCGSYLHWPQRNLADDEWEAVRPALLLASRIITAPEQLPFWYGLMHPKCIQGRDYAFHAKKKLTAAETAETLKTLEDFAEHVMFSFEKIDSAYGITAFNGLLAPDHPDWDPTIPVAENFCGAGWKNGKRCTVRKAQPSSYVALCEDFLVLLKDFKNKTLQQLHYTYFQLGNVMLHECVHALVNYLHYRGRECYSGSKKFYFNGEPQAEEGFSYDNYVFGSVPEHPIHVDKPTIYVFVWPSYSIALSYAARQAKGTGRGTKPTRFLGPADDQCHYILYSEIARLFRQIEWENFEQKKRRRAYKKPPAGDLTRRPSIQRLRFLRLRKCCDSDLLQEELDYLDEEAYRAELGEAASMSKQPKYDRMPVEIDHREPDLSTYQWTRRHQRRVEALRSPKYSKSFSEQLDKVFAKIGLPESPTAKRTASDAGLSLTAEVWKRTRCNFL